MPTLQRAPEVDGRILEVEWDHPAADGLVGFWVAGCSVNVANGKEPKFRALGRGRPSGLSGRFAGTVSTDSRVVGVGSNWGFATAFTTGTAATTSAIVGVNAASGAGEGFGFHATHSSAPYAGAIYAGSSYSVIGKPTGGALSNNTRYVIGASRAGNNGKVYRNGIVTASAGSLSAPPACAVLTLGNHSNGTGGWSVAPDFEYFLLWSKAPSPAVFFEVAREWRRLLRKTSILIPAASGNTGTSSTTLDNLTLSATASITAQGQASIALADVTLSATGASVNQGAASITLAGATLSAAGSITAQGAANITLADLSLAATGESTPVGSGTASITLDDVGVAATGSLVSRGQATLTLADLGLSAVGALTNRGQAAITLDALLLSASGANSDAVIYTRAPRGGGYPATVPTTERYGMTNTKRPAMTNTRR